MLNGREYKISANEGKNTLHGGNGLSKRRFTEIAVGRTHLLSAYPTPTAATDSWGKSQGLRRKEFSRITSLSISYEGRVRCRYIFKSNKSQPF